MTATRTYALMSVPRAMFDLVRGKLQEAGYDHAIDDDSLDMHGIALVVEEAPARPDPTPWRCIECDGDNVTGHTKDCKWRGADPRECMHAPPPSE